MKIFSFILFLGLTVLLFWMITVRGVETLIRQHRAESYPGIQGVMLASDVRTYRGSKGGIRYRAAFLYQYVVNDVEYRGARYRYGGYPTDAATANELVAGHPKGSAVTVYYNPENPWDSLLAPRVEPRDVSLLFILTPVTVVMLVPLINLWQAIEWPFRSPPLAGGVKVITEGQITRVRLPKYQPWLLGLLAVGLVSLLAGIVVACGLWPCPPMQAGGWSLALVLLGGMAMFGWQHQKIASGRQDLVIDDGMQTFELPLTYKRSEQRPIPLSEIKAVSLKQVAHHTKNGVYYTYAPTLELANGASECLTDLGKGRAESFANWLREKLGIRAA